MGFTSIWHWVIVLIVVLVLFGGKGKLSALMGDFGKGLKKLLVITRGEKGAISILGDKVSENGVEKNLNIKDLTGAGDLFAAGFLHGHVNSMTLKECLNKGTEMSSKVIQQIGARL